MIRSFALPIERPAILGILNITPDSFSDGGLYFEPEKALEHAYEMIEEGADLIDIGGESTRPGSDPVPLEEELRRVIPVLEKLCEKGIPVSIDTSKPEVARQALQAGAQVVNDVTALADSKMAEVCAEAGCTVCLMHMQGNPKTMQQEPKYQDVVQEVKEFLVQRAQWAQTQGIRQENIWIDPGIGFGKTTEHNIKLIQGLAQLVETGYPVLVGVSRKAFIGRLLGEEANPLPHDQRLEGSLAVQGIAQTGGAKIIRTHDVLATHRSCQMLGLVFDSQK